MILSLRVVASVSTAAPCLRQEALLSRPRCAIQASCLLWGRTGGTDSLQARPVCRAESDALVREELPAEVGSAASPVVARRLRVEEQYVRGAPSAAQRLDV